MPKIPDDLLLEPELPDALVVESVVPAPLVPDRRSRGRGHYCWSGGLKTLRVADDALNRSEEDQTTMLRSLANRVVLDEATNCWEWTGFKNNSGYARVGTCLVSRLMYVLTRKEPLGDLKALHTCDNPACINPEHLFKGTQLDNVLDMRHKGRGNDLRGEEISWAKLTEEKVKEIKQLRKKGIPFRTIGDMYGVSKTTVQKIISGRIWRHVV